MSVDIAKNHMIGKTVPRYRSYLGIVRLFQLVHEAPCIFLQFDKFTVNNKLCFSIHSIRLQLIDISSRLYSVQFSSVTQSGPTLCDPMDSSTPGFPVHHQFLKFTQTHVHGVSDAIQPSHPLSSPSPPAFNLPSIRVFTNELVLHIRWPKYWSFIFSISFSNEHSGLISFRMEWLDLLSVQGTLKSLLQHHS